MHNTLSPSTPISLNKSTEAQIYSLFAMSLALTCVGILLGIQFSAILLNTGLHFFFLFAELGLIFSARFWMDKTPLNYILFGLFPVLSGFTITPYILSVLVGYANGGTILMNAFASTVFMAAGSAVFARTTSWNLSGLGRAMIFGLIGLIGLSLLQFFVPALRTTGMELAISGFGVVFFAIFTAYDVQRIAKLGKMGANPFMLALSLYLDIFNLFLYILRFMLVLYGDRR
ncbi:MAG: Bax inhibitor-1 family protein [bacterium]|nr:Bax inhibitor-1 family protein [bacterium]MDA1292729.1 Bax inhibitor-1 family protein [bacterium]